MDYITVIDTEAEWSDQTTDTSPTGRKFLGQFGNHNARLALSCIPEHEMLHVSFDLYIIRSWDGTTGTSGGLSVAPDYWSFSASNDTVLLTTFSNWSVDTQAYPMAYPYDSNPAFTEASELFALGYTFTGIPMDATYHLSFLLPHNDDTLELDFAGMGLQPIQDESWGLDNIEIRIVDSVIRIYLPMVGR